MITALLLAGCAADPGPVEETCTVVPVPAGEVRATRIVCEEQLVAGGEGRVGDWLLENAVARFVVRDTYASLTQLGEAGGGLVDASLLGGPDLLMELLPVGERGSASATVTGDEGVVEIGAFAWRLAADESTLHLEGEPPAATWVPRPGVDRWDLVSRVDEAFLGVAAEDVSGEGGQLAVAGLTGVELDAAAWYADAAPIAGPVDADAVDLFAADGRQLDRVPVLDGELAVGLPAGATATGYRPGCSHAGLELVACGGLRVRARDDAGRALAVTVHFGGADFPLPEGGGRAPLGPDGGEVWVWAGPGYSAWQGWFPGGEANAEVRLTRVLPAEREWPAEAGSEAPADWESGGVLLADFALEVAPDADHAEYSADALHAARAEGVGYAVLLADDEVPVSAREAHDDIRVSLGTRTGGDAWAWGVSPNSRRAAHGAPDWPGFGALDRLTLVRGGAGADRFTIVTRTWVAAARGEGEPWSWPVRPSALWMEGPADVGALVELCEDWVDVQPLARRTWLPYVGATSTTAALGAVYARTASAGNGPMVELSANTAPLVSPLPTLHLAVHAPTWMGQLTTRLYTGAGVRHVLLDDDGRASIAQPEPGWAFVLVEGERALPWGGEAAWAVSAVRWLDQPG